MQEWKEHAGRYSEYDASGIPTKDAEGKDVSKGMRKKLEGELKKHAKEYAAAQK